MPIQDHVGGSPPKDGVWPPKNSQLQVESAKRAKSHDEDHRSGYLTDVQEKLLEVRNTEPVS